MYQLKQQRRSCAYSKKPIRRDIYAVYFVYKKIWFLFLALTRDVLFKECYVRYVIVR